MVQIARKARPELPVLVIGGGPVGLVAGAHLVRRGERPLILEAARAVGENIREWAHVRLFSPWKYLTDPVAVEMLEREGWSSPDPESLPFGDEFVERFLDPLAALPQLAEGIQVNRRVVAVSRTGVDKAKSDGREHAPFEVLARRNDGRIERYYARALIDASGTYQTPNPLGANGVPVPGEAELAESIHYGIPDVRGPMRSRYSGKRILVVGSGHSAFNAVLDLSQLARTTPCTEVAWTIRRDGIGDLFGGGEDDALPARGRLGSRLRELVERGDVPLYTGVRVSELRGIESGILVTGESDQVIGPVDEIVVTTGFRPDVNMLREVRLALDPALEAPVRLAPMIDPSRHDCGTVQPHGFEELSHPEPNLFVVGMKSYGRAPTFLLPTGYEQVRSVVAALTGDLESARTNRLMLPETDVCVTDSTAPGCCGVTTLPGASAKGRSTESSCSPEPVRSAGERQGSRAMPTSPSSGDCCG